MDLKYGYLKESDAGLIDSIDITNGQVINSEKHGIQFIDFNNKRHSYSYGTVLSGMYSDTDGYVDFNEFPVAYIINAIKIDPSISIKDGQIIKCENTLYQYRKIENKNFIIKMNDDYIDTIISRISYAIYLPEYNSGDEVNIDILLTISNSTHGDKLFLIKIINNTIDLTRCEDMDGTFDSSTFDISVTHDTTNKLFAISTDIESKLKVISYSVSSSGSSQNEGFYVVEHD